MHHKIYMYFDMWLLLWGGCVSLIHFQRMTAPRESITAITTKIIMRVLGHWETCNSMHLKLPPESILPSAATSLQRMTEKIYEQFAPK